MTELDEQIMDRFGVCKRAASQAQETRGRAEGRWWRKVEEHNWRARLARDHDFQAHRGSVGVIDGLKDGPAWSQYFHDMDKFHARHLGKAKPILQGDMLRL